MKKLFVICGLLVSSAAVAVATPILNYTCKAADGWLTVRTEGVTAPVYSVEYYGPTEHQRFVATLIEGGGAGHFYDRYDFKVESALEKNGQLQVSKHRCVGRRICDGIDHVDAKLTAGGAETLYSCDENL